MPLNNMATNSLKIGIILDTSLDTNEGVPQYVACIGEWLRDQGNDVHYLVGQTEKRQLQNIHSLSRNITVQFNGNRTTIPLPTSKRKLRRFMSGQNFDILYVQTPHHPLMAQRLIKAAKPGTAVAGLFHILPYGWLSKYGTKLLGIWLKPSLRRFDKMMAVSKAAADFEKWSFGLDAEVMPNVFNYDQFSKAKPFEKYQDGTKTILFLGRLVQRKGCQTLLEAVAKLVKDKDLPGFRVVICGRGALEPKLMSFVNNNGLSDIVEFTGYVSEQDKPRYYASADISVFPSSAGESFGIVLLEAMASGQATVLAGDNPGYRSVMSEKPELLFAPKDAGLLATKIKGLLQDDQRRKDLAAWGSDFTRGFDVSVVGKRLLTVFDEILLKRRGL
jgi:phosphatidylinositol alpha-mannosyltransferase